MSFNGSIETEFSGERFELLPDRAVWWPLEKTLIVADVHLGKGTAFRQAGLPVPKGSSGKDLGRLSVLLTETSAERLLILGDLIHARRSRQQNLDQAIARWRSSIKSTDIVLIRGNHDRAAGKVHESWNIREAQEPFTVRGIQFEHAPPETVGRATMAGHIHPVCRLQDYDGSYATADCFVFDERVAVLPAFGTFTGGCPVHACEGRHLYVTTGRKVVVVRSLPIS